MTNTPLNGIELARALGISEASYHVRRKRGEFRHLELTRPVGQRRYSRSLVEQFLAGQSTVRLGRRAS